MIRMKNFKSLLTLLTITGNIVFVLWILYNGINEGFSGTLPEKLSYLGLMVLLSVNACLLIAGSGKNK